MPVSIENNIPRLDARGQHLMVRDAVQHEALIRAVPVVVDAESFLDDFFQAGATCAAVD